MELTRKKIYDIIDAKEANSVWDRVYDAVMILMIICSIVPLAFRTQLPAFEIMDMIAVAFFILDYLLRWATADLAMPDKPRWQAFLTYPFTAFAILDLLAIVPSFSLANRGLKALRIPRLLKVLRVFKIIRYSRKIQILMKVLSKEKGILLTVLFIAVMYIITTALIMFNVEESAMFETFLDAHYWATTTLTTVGYGDICPQTDMGRVVSMFSALMGVAIIALPSGVITASFLDELREEKKQAKKE